MIERAIQAFLSEGKRLVPLCIGHAPADGEQLTIRCRTVL